MENRKKQHYDKKKFIWLITSLLSFCVFLVLLWIYQYKQAGLDHQTMAARWSDKKDVTQISAFFSTKAGITEDALIQFGHTLDSLLQEASIENPSENPQARLWVAAYSATGEVNLSAGKRTMTADCLGVGGDFFLFHPLKLLTGSYFSGSDINQDYCLLDEDGAWQLFGSNDIAGQIIYLDEKPLVVAGVIEREKGRLPEAAGLSSTIVYLSYDKLKEHNQGEAPIINHYEIVMPNPVKGFAIQKVRENLQVDEKEVEIVENTRRFDLLNSLKLFTQLGTRSMNGKAIIYPYWENIARGYEDILAILVLGMMITFGYPFVSCCLWLCYKWRHKGFTVKDAILSVKDKLDRKVEKIRAEKSENSPCQIKRKDEEDYEKE